MPTLRVVTDDGATDYDDAVKATVEHCRNVGLNRTSLLMRVFDDGLPGEELRKPEIIDNYPRSEERAARSRHTFTLGKPEPAFPREQAEPMAEALEPESWRVRAFYYALGQVESLWELSPLVTGDAVSFSYHWQACVTEGTVPEPSNLTLRNEWVVWEAGRRANLEQHGRPKVAAFTGALSAGVHYLEGGEHDPDLGPDMGDGR